MIIRVWEPLLHIPGPFDWILTLKKQEGEGKVLKPSSPAPDVTAIRLQRTPDLAGCRVNRQVGQVG